MPRPPLLAPTPSILLRPMGWGAESPALGFPLWALGLALRSPFLGCCGVSSLYPCPLRLVPIPHVYLSHQPLLLLPCPPQGLLFPSLPSLALTQFSLYLLSIGFLLLTLSSAVYPPSPPLSRRCPSYHPVLVPSLPWREGPTAPSALTACLVSVSHGLFLPHLLPYTWGLQRLPSPLSLPPSPVPVPSLLDSHSWGGPCGNQRGRDGCVPALVVFLSCLGTDGPVINVSQLTEFISCSARSWDHQLHVSAACSSSLTGTWGHCPVT